MNNEIWEKNINALRKSGKYNVDFFVKRLNCAQSNDIGKTLNFEECLNGRNKTARLKTADGRLIYMASKYDPLAEAEEFVQKELNKDTKELVIMGFGLGYEIRAVLKRLGEDIRVIITEPDINCFISVMLNLDISDIINDKRIYILAWEKPDIAYGNIDMLTDWKNSDSMSVLINKRYMQLFPKEAIGMLNIVSALKKDKLLDRNTIINNAENWFKNRIGCLPVTVTGAYPVSSFYNSFKGRTAVMVSAGPSLDKNAELLKAIKGKILIAAAFTAVKALKRLGIEPDLMMSIDGKQTGIDRESEKIPLIYFDTINRDFFYKHKGRKIFAARDAFSVDLLKKYNKFENMSLQSGGSVACSVMDFLVLCGCKTVIMIGQDLAYTNKQTHAQGTVHEIRNIDGLKNRELFEVDAIGGGKVLTDDIWKSYQSWFEIYMKQNEKRVLFIDSTEGGALKKNCLTMPFKEALEKYCCDGYDVNKLLEEAFSKGRVFKSDEQQAVLDDLRKAKKALKDYYDRLDEADELSGRLIKNAKYGSWDKSASLIKRLDEINGSVKKMGYFMGIMDSVANKISCGVNEITSQGGGENVITALKYAKKYELEGEAFKEVLSFMEKAEKEISEYTGR